MSAFDADAPTIGDTLIKWVKSVFADIKRKAIVLEMYWRFLMGLDLVLFPSTTYKLNRFVSFSQMMVNRDGWAHCVREHCPTYRYLYTLELEYQGEPLDTNMIYTYVKDLLAIENGNIRMNGKQTSAALAYLRELKPDTPVILHFC